MGKRTLGLWGLAVLAMLAPASLAAQNRQITGRVTRAGSAEPVPAAAVAVLGEPDITPVLTDADGRFSIAAPAGEVTLQVSAFGYTQVNVVVAAGRNTVDIGLEYDVFNLDELVVTGQATTVERRSATTAIAYVSGEDVSRVSSPTILNAMAGKVAGVNLQTNSGAPGGGIQLQIRGNNTILGAFDPLFVVDGVIYSNASIPGGRGFANDAANPSMEADAVNRIADINPADIESIEVLKGAAASSIYGSKASNGVVVITTRRGRAGPPQVNVTERLGVFTPLRLLDTRRWTEEEAVAKFGEAARPFFEGNPNPYYDHYETVFGNRKLSHETVASVSGGNLDTRYYISGTWKRDEGIEIGTGAGRQAVRVNFDHVFSPELDLKVSTGYNRSENDRGWDNNCNNFGCMGYAIAYIPSFVNLKAKNPDGTYVPPVDDVSPPSNPLQLAHLGVNHEETNRFTGGLTLGWNAIESDDQTLRLVAGGGLDAFDQVNDVWTPNELFFEQVEEQPGESIESGGRSLYYNWNVNGIHTWNAPSWSTVTSFGLQYEDRRLHTYRIRTAGLLPGQRNVDQGAPPESVESLNQERTLALYAQEALHLFEDQLLLEAGVRAERSSVNGDIDKYYVFPKVSGSYRFLNLLGDGSEVKLRAAYGETGNQPLFGQKFTTLETPTLGGKKGYAVSTVAGFEDVEPERVKEVEVGLDGLALDGRLNWALTVFDRNTTNLLLERVPAPSSGFTTQIFNGGKLRNRGFEAALGFTPVLTDNTQWISRGTFTLYRNEVVDLAGLPPFFPAGSGFGALGQTRVEVGKPVTQIVGFDFAAGSDTERADTLSQLGNTAPDFRVGFVNDVSYKALDVSFVLDWQQGGDVINLTQFLLDDAGNSADYGTPEWEARYNGYKAGAITPYIEDATFLKVREVSVSLELPNSILAPLNLDTRSIRVGLTGTNLFMWTKYSGLDPEVANFGAAAIRSNLDIAPYPPSRSIFFNISVGF
ncbi:MAG TPA: SusC/RagA family TonB-linked outer membrane protein [Longimicrobiales bacterium]